MPLDDDSLAPGTDPAGSAPFDRHALVWPIAFAAAVTSFCAALLVGSLLRPDSAAVTLTTAAAPEPPGASATLVDHDSVPPTSPAVPTTTAAPTIAETAPTPPVETSPIVIAVGDIACRAGYAATPTDCQHRATSDLALEIAPDAVFVLGDLQYPAGSLKDFEGSYDPTWGRLKEITYPVPGNHEYATRGAAGYYDYFYGPDEPIRSTGYYSFDLGEWHLVALNSNCEIVSCVPGSAQEQWLRADLAGNDSACVLAFWHHPWVTSGDRGPTLEVRPLVDALYEAGADVILAGHDHFYERFALQDPAGKADATGGIREFVVGTGGKQLRGAGPDSYPNREIRTSDTVGVLQLTLHPGRYDWQFVPVPGYPFADAGSTACH